MRNVLALVLAVVLAADAGGVGVRRAEEVVELVGQEEVLVQEMLVVIVGAVVAEATKLAISSVCAFSKK